ncbi:hypothetical protein ACLI4Q_06135 [Natrialbaceae archaeon A-CW1-1]
MSKYDDLFEATAPDDSVFADKSALDPLQAPAEIVARDAHKTLSLIRQADNRSSGCGRDHQLVGGHDTTIRTLTGAIWIKGLLSLSQQ